MIYNMSRSPLFFILCIALASIAFGGDTIGVAGDDFILIDSDCYYGAKVSVLSNTRAPDYQVIGCEYNPSEEIFECVCDGSHKEIIFRTHPNATNRYKIRYQYHTAPTRNETYDYGVRSDFIAYRVEPPKVPFNFTGLGIIVLIFVVLGVVLGGMLVYAYIRSFFDYEDEDEED